MRRANVANNSVCAISVLYHPTATEVENCFSLLSQVDHLVIFDNTPQPIPNILVGCVDPSRVTLIQKGKNQGMAGALNEGARLAISKGYQWLLTMDQDSKLEENSISRLLKEASDPPGAPIGLIAPQTTDGRVAGTAAGVPLLGEASVMTALGNNKQKTHSTL